VDVQEFAPSTPARSGKSRRRLGITLTMGRRYGCPFSPGKNHDILFDGAIRARCPNPIGEILAVGVDL